MCARCVNYTYVSAVLPRCTQYNMTNIQFTAGMHTCDILSYLWNRHALRVTKVSLRSHM